MDLILWSGAILVGIILLVKSGDKLSDKIVEVAEKAGVSPLIISIVVISLATTLPEITTSAIASYEGANGIALGNALGSIFANIALILGMAALLRPLESGREAFKNSIAMLLSLLLVILLSLDGELSRADGAILLMAYVIYLYWLYRSHVGLKVEEHRGESTPFDYLLLLILGLLLVAGAKLVVYGGENIAEKLGVSEYVIGATVVAIGTSLPEMTNALYGALRNRGSVSVGNIIGANIMNALIVLGLASLIRPIQTAASVLTLVFVFSAMIPLIISLRLRNGLDRRIGVYFLSLYALYLFLLLKGASL